MPAQNETVKTFYGKPGEGRVVRDPARGSQRVPDEPRAYPMTGYWARRFACGDMVEVSAPSAARRVSVKRDTQAASATDA